MANGEATRDDKYGWLFPVAKVVLPPVIRFAWRIHAEGLENLPAKGPAILCANHTSVLDSFLMPVAVFPASAGRRVMFVGKAEYLDSWKTRHVFPALGMIPIDRAGGDASQRALDLASEALDRGELFGIYPEGTRSRDGRLHKGHTGPARLALRTGAPLIPVGIIGSRRIQPPEAKFPKVFEPCLVRVGKPIRPEHYGDGTAAGRDRLVLRQITDELMFEIRNLSGQDYVDEYATKKKEARAAGSGKHVVDGPEAQAAGSGERFVEAQSSRDVLAAVKRSGAVGAAR